MLGFFCKASTIQRLHAAPSVYGLCLGVLGSPLCIGALLGCLINTPEVSWSPPLHGLCLSALWSSQGFAKPLAWVLQKPHQVAIKIFCYKLNEMSKAAQKSYASQTLPYGVGSQVTKSSFFLLGIAWNIHIDTGNLFFPTLLPYEGLKK